MSRAIWLLGLGCWLYLSGLALAEEPRREEGRSAPLGRAFEHKELEATEAELLQTRSELRRKKVELAVLVERLKRGDGKSAVAEHVLGDILARDAVYTSLMARVQAIKNMLAEPRRVPELEDLEKQMVARRQQILGSLEQQAQKGFEQKILDVQDRIAYLTQLDKTLADDAARLRARLGEGKGESTEQRLERLERQIKELHRALKELAEQTRKK
jgi:hypothetical protein